MSYQRGDGFFIGVGIGAVLILVLVTTAILRDYHSHKSDCDAQDGYLIKDRSGSYVCLERDVVLR